MGLGKWWLKHGPGSPGAIAKAMTKKYLRIKAEFPSATEEQLITLLIKDRINVEQNVGIPPLSQSDIIELVEEVNGELKDVILYFVHRENPEAQNTYINFPEIYQNMLEVIEEVVDKYIK